MEAAELTQHAARMVASIANAPCSYGAFEETVGVDPLVPDALELLDQVTAAGYAGIDLGPVGYLGNVEELPAQTRGPPAGARRRVHGAAVRRPRRAPRRDLCSWTRSSTRSMPPASSEPAPRPTLAGMSVPEARLAADGRAARGPRWSPEAWQRYADGVSTVVERCRQRGYEPTFHHHVGTEIETPEEIDRLLSLTDVGLCVDTGHLAVAAGDAIDAVRRWGPRINHVHMKDADASALAALAAEGAPVDELWRGQVFVPLGDGDLDCSQFLRALENLGYRGWIVVEQDIFPQHGARADKVKLDQERSREFLTRHGL